MVLALPKAEGKEAGKGRKPLNMNNHKCSWKNICRGGNKTPKQPNNYLETNKYKNKIQSKLH